MREEHDPELEVPGDTTVPTGEVGSEGGTEGAVERGRAQEPTSGSESTETKRPQVDRTIEIRRDETGAGRRSP